MIDAAGTWIAAPPSIRVISTVGSGDSFLAGLLVALERGAAAAEALCYAVAAGAANAQSLGGAHFALEDFKHVLALTKAQTLS
jgi:fructose-1-phosphate kinase PfkB-like protein